MLEQDIIFARDYNTKTPQNTSKFSKVLYKKVLCYLQKEYI